MTTLRLNLRAPTCVLACDNRNFGQAAATAKKHFTVQPLPERSKVGQLVYGDEMKKPVTKLLLGTSAALAMLIAAAEVAQAQEYRSEDAAYRTAPQAYDAEGNPSYGFGPRVTVQPDDVVAGNRIIGRDPDPFIRGELLRHYDSGWPD
jgi:hypothetical protein